MKYCPECREILKPVIIDGKERLACPSCDFVFWNNPVPVAAAVLLHKDEVVLVRPNYLPKGMWGLPAGYIEAGETAEEAALREIKEETGLAAVIERLIGTYIVIRPNKPLLFIAFFAKAYDGQLRAEGETADVASFAPQEASRILTGTTAGRALSDWMKSI